MRTHTHTHTHRLYLVSRFALQRVTHTHTLSLTLTHSHPDSLVHTHTHTHTHTQFMHTQRHLGAGGLRLALVWSMHTHRHLGACEVHIHTNTYTLFLSRTRHTRHTSCSTHTLGHVGVAAVVAGGNRGATLAPRKGCMQFDHECNLINFPPDICVHTYTHREFAYYVVYESLYSLIQTRECIQRQFDSGMQHEHPIRKYDQIVNIHHQ